jgi:predicted RNA-binding Zn-ribbon protein involved in translation (DUF1610 family)
MVGFKTTCNKCGSDKVDVMPYEDKTVFECENCGQIIMLVAIDD